MFPGCFCCLHVRNAGMPNAQNQRSGISIMLESRAQTRQCAAGKAILPSTQTMATVISLVTMPIGQTLLGMSHQQNQSQGSQHPTPQATRTYCVCRKWTIFLTDTCPLPLSSTPRLPSPHPTFPSPHPLAFASPSLTILVPSSAAEAKT